MKHVPCILSLALSLISWLLTGCIHTYPKGEPYDPTLITAELDLALEIPDKTLLAWENKAEGETDGISLPLGAYHFVARIDRNSKTEMFIDTVVRYNPHSAKTIRFRLSHPLKPLSYNLYVWGELADPSELTPLHYDASELSKIAILPFQEETHASAAKLAPPFCFAASTELNLNSPDTKRGEVCTVHLPLHIPAAFIRITPTDAEDFLHYFPEAATDPTAFSISLQIDSPAALSFNLPTFSPSSYLTSFTFSSPLLLAANPSAKVMFVPVFCSSEGESLSAGITVFNSARSIVSRIRNLSIPISRAEVTTISGKILTNWFESAVSVDKDWNGEIIIRH